jgi:hypothetical protein
MSQERFVDGTNLNLALDTTALCGLTGAVNAIDTYPAGSPAGTGLQPEAAQEGLDFVDADVLVVAGNALVMADVLVSLVADRRRRQPAARLRGRGRSGRERHRLRDRELRAQRPRPCRVDDARGWDVQPELPAVGRRARPRQQPGREDRLPPGGQPHHCQLQRDGDAHERQRLHELREGLRGNHGHPLTHPRRALYVRARRSTA